MDIRQPNPTQAAGILRKFLAESGIEIKHMAALEAVARMRGYSDAQAMAADQKAKAERDEAYPRLLQADPNDEDNSDFVYVDNPANKRAWVTIGNMALNFGPTHEGLIVDVFAHGAEMGGSLGTIAIPFEDATWALIEDKGIDYHDLAAWCQSERGVDFDTQPPAKQKELVDAFCAQVPIARPVHPDAAVVTWRAAGGDGRYQGFSTEDQAPLDYWDNLLVEEERQRIRKEYSGAVENKEQSAEPGEQRYVHGEWDHCFFGSRATTVRFVFDREANEIVAMDVRAGRKWVLAHRSEIEDLEDSLKTANNDVLEDPAESGLEASSELPDWARNRN